MGGVNSKEWVVFVDSKQESEECNGSKRSQRNGRERQEEKHRLKKRGEWKKGEELRKEKRLQGGSRVFVEEVKKRERRNFEEEEVRELLEESFGRRRRRSFGEELHFNGEDGEELFVNPAKNGNVFSGGSSKMNDEDGGNESPRFRRSRREDSSGTTATPTMELPAAIWTSAAAEEDPAATETLAAEVAAALERPLIMSFGMEESPAAAMSAGFAATGDRSATGLPAVDRLPATRRTPTSTSSMEEWNASTRAD